MTADLNFLELFLKASIVVQFVIVILIISQLCLGQLLFNVVVF